MAYIMDRAAILSGQIFRQPIKKGEGTMKNCLCYFMVVLFFLIAPNCWAYTSGQGTQADPYEIANANDLLELAETTGDYAKHFILTADIDMTGEGPFHTAVIAPDTSDSDYFQGPAFNGVFDGNGHVILNLVIDPNTNSDYIGLFGYAGYYPNSAEIRDLGIENISINGYDGHKSVGAIVGEMYNGNIKRCYTTGSITLGSGCQNVGGLMGYSTSADISNSYSKCSVSCDSNSSKIGGFLGGCYNISLKYNYSAGTVSVGDNSTDIGGFLGVSDNFLTALANFCDIDASGQSVGVVATGLQSVEMFSKSPFLEAGWDFIDETLNGENDYWKSPTKSYPILSWQEYTIGLPDLIQLADNWLTDSQDPNVIYPVDLWQDGRVDYKDFAVLGNSWLGDRMLIQFGEIFEGFETGDFSALNWSGMGTVPWQITGSDFYEGAYCATVQGVPPTYSSQLSLDVTCGEGKIGFYYKNTGSRYILVYIDGIIAGLLGQSTNWSYAEYDITEGTHNVSWFFHLPFGGSEEDIAKLDNIRIFNSD